MEGSNQCHVQVLTSLDEARTAAHQREGSAIAKYNFKAQSPIELSLRVVSCMCVSTWQLVVFVSLNFMYQ